MPISGKATSIPPETLAPETLDALPAIPRAGAEPVFREPWEAQAFAMAVRLNERGVFNWNEWAEALSAEIKAAGRDDAPENYYQHWLSALEKLVTEKQLMSARDLADRKDAWDRAARATPHGAPIMLGADESE